MVLLEDLGRHGDVEVLGAALAPRQLGDRLEIGADHLGLHGLAAHAPQPPELAVDLLADLRRQVEGVELLAQLVDVARAVPLAELLLDRLELLAQEHLALAVAQLFLDLGLDVLLGLQHVELALDVDQDAPHALLDREGLEQHLALLLAEIGVAGHEVGEPARLLDPFEHLLDDLFGQAGLGAQLRRPLPQFPEERDEGRILGIQRLHLLRLAHGGLQMAVLLDDLHRDAAILAVEEELHARETPLELADTGHRADGVEHLGGDLLNVLALRHREHQPLGRVQGGLNGLEGGGLAGVDRRRDIRQEDEIPQRQDGKRHSFSHLDLLARPRHLGGPTVSYP